MREGCPRILFVAPPDSVHTARWISQLAAKQWDIHLFPAYTGDLHPELRSITIHDRFGQRLERWVSRLAGIVVRYRGGYRITSWLRSVARGWPRRNWRLARVIRRLKPDLIHTLEMQRSAYLALDAKQLIADKPFPPWAYSCWGNDIYLFRQRPEHRERIRAVLENCDYLITDCDRDRQLARDHGFSGVILGTFPVGGGYLVSDLRGGGLEPRVSQRKVILLKGYQSELYGGRALVGLHALHLCAEHLQEYEIVIHSAWDHSVRQAAAYEMMLSGLNIRTLGDTSHKEMMRLMGRARIAIALSVSDGTPQTMLEAMIMGAFPVQSDTISTQEYIRDGENGLLVPADDAKVVARAIQRALTDDALVDDAAAINAELMERRIDRSVVEPLVIAAYDRVLNGEEGT